VMVTWKFDRSGMPQVPGNVRDRSYIIDHLMRLNSVLDELCKEAAEEERSGTSALPSSSSQE